MSHRSVPSGSGHITIPIERVQGKPLRAVHVYQAEETLNLGLEFEDDVSLEVMFRVGFQTSAKVLQYTNGSARVLDSLALKRL